MEQNATTNSNSHNHNTTTIETQNNIENQNIETQNNVIVVNSFGNENTDYLTDRIVTTLIKNGPCTCLPKIETQNIIVVNSFGNENIEHLTDQIICKLIQYSPFKCVPELIKKIHFDPEHPENHNIKLTNKKLNYAEIVKDNKWITTNKKKVIDDVIQNSYNILDNSYSDNKDSISDKQQERFDNFQEKYENEDESLHRSIKEDVDLVLINGTNEVHK